MSDWQTEAFRRLATPLDRVVGAATAKAFGPLGVTNLGGLLALLPRHLMSGTDLTDIASLLAVNRGSEEYIALVARVAAVTTRGEPPRQRVEVTLSDGRGQIGATFFGQPRLIAFWKRLLSQSDRGVFAGKLSWFNGQPQLAHPGFVMITPEGFQGTARNTRMAQRVAGNSFIGLYHQTASLPTWTVAESIDLGLAQMADVADPLPDWVRQAAGVVDLAAAYHGVHQPTSREQYDAGVQRLLFDEAFASQAAMAYRRADAASHTAIPRAARADGLVAAFDRGLPFDLTAGQIEVGQTIAAELAQRRPMQRLLQGEVGSGKTVVAVRAMLTVVDAGGQAALLAPTEILAQQHYETVSELLGPLGQAGLTGTGTDVVLLTGSIGAAAKASALERIASGRAGIVIGTHALLAEAVSFADLGLVVVDEQHRFGVEQRNDLAGRGAARPHILVMTATPIPRSVAMTVFGDLDVSALTEVPAGRAEVTTVVVDQVVHPVWVERVWSRIAEEVAQSRQAYIVAPRIEAGAAGDGESVIELYDRLTAGPLAGCRVGLLHGRLPAGEKTAVMAAFDRGDLDVLIATSMIEVGLDQPRATVMAISQADRFGISQLHQLRGRIGRADLPGVCLLLTDAAEGTPARDRLETLAATRDGFALAQADLAQRREGDVLGSSQSGRQSSLRLLRVLDHADLIEQARQIAAIVVERDPSMSHPGVADYVHEIELRSTVELDEAA